MKRWIRAGSLTLVLVALAVVALPAMAATGRPARPQVAYMPGQRDTAQAASMDAGTMHVEAIDMRYKRAGRSYFVYAEVTIVDELGNPVSGAAVDVALEFPTGTGVLKSATTGAIPPTGQPSRNRSPSARDGSASSRSTRRATGRSKPRSSGTSS